MSRDDPRGSAMAARVCRAGSAGAVTAFCVLAVSAVLAGISAGAPPRGEAQVVTPQDGSASAGKPLAEGSAATPFTLELPAGAACTGDSTNGGYRVQSFMVPEDVDPGGLTFGALGPLPKGVGPEFRQPLYAVNTTPFANAATNLADEPGGPGTVINIPSFDLDVFSGDDLPAGRFTIGIACTKGPPSSTQVDRFWTAALDLTAGSSGGAAAWTVSGTAAPEAAMTTTDTAAPASAPAEGADPSATPPSTAMATPTTSGSSTGTSGAGPSGEPPTFHYPAAELVSHLSIAGSTTKSLVLWLVIALVVGRMAYLFARGSVLAPPALT